MTYIPYQIIRGTQYNGRMDPDLTWEVMYVDETTGSHRFPVGFGATPREALMSAIRIYEHLMPLYRPKPSVDMLLCSDTERVQHEDINVVAYWGGYRSRLQQVQVVIVPILERNLNPTQ